MAEHALTEIAAEGYKTKYMSALNSFVAPVPAWEHVFVLNDTNRGTGERGKGGGGNTDSKAVGTSGQDEFIENGNLLLHSADDDNLALLNTFFCTSKSGVSYIFQSTKRGKGQSRLDFILTTQEDHQLVRPLDVCPIVSYDVIRILCT